VAKTNFNFQLIEVQIECAHCQHQLEGVGKFGLEIVRCGNCSKFSQITSRASSARVKTPVKDEE
jgi:Zn finger protein HypA/HybF involved in hydrogenase expression